MVLFNTVVYFGPDWLRAELVNILGLVNRGKLPCLVALYNRVSTRPARSTWALAEGYTSFLVLVFWSFGYGEIGTVGFGLECGRGSSLLVVCNMSAVMHSHTQQSIHIHY